MGESYLAATARMKAAMFDAATRSGDGCHKG
jgi:hypothetical protein